MKKYLTLPTIMIAFIVLVSAGKRFSQEIDYSDFLKKYNSKWGEKCLNCGNYTPNSYTAYYRNIGKEKIDVKGAVQESNKQWRTFLRNDVAPNDSVVIYACDGTGKSMVWAKRAGDRTTSFPTDDEINKQYGGK